MRGVRTGHVVLGGLAAGLVVNIGEAILNVVLLGDQMSAAMARMNLRVPSGAATMTAFVVLGFALGFAVTWLYAAIRPRYGAGPATAVRAALAAYFFAYFYPAVGMLAMGMFPASMIVISLVWGLAEIVVAAMAGSWVYTEAPLPGEARV